LKLFHTIEGGAIIYDDDELAKKKIRLYRSCTNPICIFEFKEYELRRNESNQQLLASLITKTGVSGSVEDIVKWIDRQNQLVNVKVEQIELKNLNKWSFKQGSLRHDSGYFFSIDGLKVETNHGTVNNWEQPIINQPEIGYLGFITKEIDGVLYFLLQAKIEPGNLNYVQLSPTLQATRSNYTQVHKGKKPNYLEYFQQVHPENIVLDQLQSEQGARFLKKRNRNIIIQVNEEIELKENYIWVTLCQIKELMRYDNIVNMDTRTVISGIMYDELFQNCDESPDLLKFDKMGQAWLSSYFDTSNSLHSLSDIISMITSFKATYDLSVEQVDLLKLQNWHLVDESIKHVDDKFFKVIAANIKIDNREVVEWTQPLIQPQQEGLCAFIIKNINGVMHFIVQAKLECGNFDVIEFAPTVQCLTGNYNNTKSRMGTPFLDYVLNGDNCQVIIDSYQSEEGGRFYKEQNRNLILLVHDDFDQNLPELYVWMTLNQLLRFIQFNNYINIQARGLIASLRFVGND
jgi:oxidase EvaA